MSYIFTFVFTWRLYQILTIINFAPWLNSSVRVKHQHRLIDTFFRFILLTECRVIILMAKVGHHHAMRRYPDHHQQSQQQQYQYHNGHNSTPTRNDSSQLSSTSKQSSKNSGETTKNHSSPGQRVSNESRCKIFWFIFKIIIIKLCKNYIQLVEWMDEKSKVLVVVVTKCKSTKVENLPF